MTRQLAGAAGIAALLLGAGAAHGDTLFGVYAGAGTWQQGYSGEVASGPDDVDVDDDLDLEDDNNNVLYLALEHGIPVLPNLRLNYTDVSTSGSNALTRTVAFSGEVFTVNEAVDSELDFTQVDVVAYYELLDNVFSLDVGVAARWVEGEVEMVSDSGFARAEFEGVLPLLYVRTRVDLPLTGLWVGAEAMGLGYDGHQLLDASAQVGWESPIRLGTEVGWRKFNLELDGFEDIDNAEIDISGPYAAINFHF
jgi:outer membrane protein